MMYASSSTKCWENKNEIGRHLRPLVFQKKNRVQNYAHFCKTK